MKYNYFHKEQKRSFKNNPFLQQNLYYNAKDDYFVCPMGRQMKRVYDTTRKNKSGFISNIAVYQAQRCQGCPLRCSRHKSKINRQINVNHQLQEYKQKAREKLTSEEGLRMRSKRPIEPEAVFGQMKFNKSYYRFRHTGKDKIKMDFAIFAIAFNLGKPFNYKKKQSVFYNDYAFYLLQNVIFLIFKPFGTMTRLQNDNKSFFQRKAA